MSLVTEAIIESNFNITEVVCGCAPGIDTLGEQWAKLNSIPIKYFHANWDDMTPPVKIKINKFGKAYNALAGFKRNQQMAEYAEALIAIPGKGQGTRDMIERATKLNRKTFVKNT